MSNHPHRRPSRNALVDMLGPLDGARIPGGCDACDAYQTVAALAAGVWQLNVHHDDWCPVLAEHTRKRNAS